jgi:hypothetical protein
MNKFNSKVFGHYPAESHRVIRGMAFGHQQPKNVVFSQGPHRQGSHHAAVDSPADRDDHSSPTQPAEDRFAHKRRDPVRFCRAIQFQETRGD